MKKNRFATRRLRIGHWDLFGIWVLAFGILSAGIASAQTRGADFQLTKIPKNLVSTPQFTYTGGQQYPSNQRDRWPLYWDRYEQIKTR